VINNIKIALNEEVYEPSDDTYILTDTAKEVLSRLENKDIIVIEIGSGTSYIIISLVKTILTKFNNVYAIATDISPCAMKSSWSSAKLNNLDMYLDIVQCDSLTCFRDSIANMVVFNPPYLPVEDSGSWISKAWSGGANGFSIWSKFFKDSINKCKSKCSILFVLSSLQNMEKIFYVMESKCLSIDVHMCKNFFFETICSVECMVSI